MHDDTSPGSEKYEQRDAHLKLIVWSGVALCMFALVFFLLGSFIVNLLGWRDAATKYVASPLAGEEEIFSTDIRLQPDPPLALERVLTEQNKLAEGWGTVSEMPLAYHIPVETAMDIVAKNGFPDVRPNPVLPPLETGDKAAH